MDEELTEPSVSEDVKILSAYRDRLQSDIADKEKDYNTTVTYITAGALALFLSINEKVFHVQAARNQWLLFASLVCLLTTIILHVLANIIDIKADKILLNKADDMVKKENYDELELTTQWRKSLKTAETVYYLRFSLMVLGIVFEAFFITLNLNAAPSKSLATNYAVSNDKKTMSGWTVLSGSMVTGRSAVGYLRSDLPESTSGEEPNMKGVRNLTSTRQYSIRLEHQTPPGKPGTNTKPKRPVKPQSPPKPPPKPPKKPIKILKGKKVTKDGK